MKDERMDSDIKWYEEIRELTARLDDDYTTGWFLDYDYIKNHYKLIAFGMSKQKKNRYWPRSNSANRIYWKVSEWCW